MIESALLIGSFLAGVAGAPHCLMMCGGYVAAFAQQATPMERGARVSLHGGEERAGRGAVHSEAVLLPASRLWVLQGVAHCGRIVSYMLLGGIFGALGRFAFVYLMAMQKGLATLAALFLLVLAVLVARGASGNALFERWGLKLFGLLLSRVRYAVQRNGVAGRFALGMLWGMTPCGLVYGVFPVALLAGGAWQGAAVMLAFGLGTLPHLLFAGYALQRLRRYFESRWARWVRYAIALVIAGFALWSLNRLWLGGGHGVAVPPTMPTQQSAPHSHQGG